MTDATVVLGRDGMGEGASLADYDAWTGYVAERIDDLTGYDLAVDRAPRHEAQETRIVPDQTYVDQQTIRDALTTLWETFCADSAAWPPRADLDAVDAAAEATAHAITNDHVGEWCEPDPWEYPSLDRVLGDECRDPSGGLLDEVKARFACAFGAVINAHNEGLGDEPVAAGEGG